MEALSGLGLLVAAAAALAWANLDATSYRDIWSQALTLGVGDVAITLDLRHWVSDGLMTLFFFVVGLEIKREFVDGELRHAKTAALPVFAAVGGMVVPALLFVAFSATDGNARRGWAIPMATDIAFALGVLALLGPRVPRGARVFLLTLAIVDDIGAIAVIAIFYAQGFDASWFLSGVAVVMMVIALRRTGRATTWVYAGAGVVLWICAHESGVQATIAGVVLALLIPAVRGPRQGSLERIERAVHPWSSFAVVPLFALANAGVALTATTLDRATTSTITGGVALGLVVGKPLGIVGATLLALRTRRATLPAGLRVTHIAAIGALAGIGFTVSLFVANLAFSGSRLGEAKVGILAASLLAGTLGVVALARLRSPDPDGEIE